MKQKKTIIIMAGLLWIMGITGLYAQQSANASGGNATGSGGSSSYSVGQVAYSYKTGSSGAMNEGVQQPYEFFTVGIDNNANIGLSVTAFPNPAQSVLNLKVENQDWENLAFALYDISGRQLLSQKLSSTLTVIPMQKLPAGTYLLKVTGAEKIVKSFNIIKNN